MALPFKKLLSKLELPENDWVLSRFGNFDEPADLAAKDSEGTRDEQAPVSQPPISVAARLFEHWFDQGPLDESAPPQSGIVVSPNASVGGAPEIPPERKSRAS